MTIVKESIPTLSSVIENKNFLQTTNLLTNAENIYNEKLRGFVNLKSNYSFILSDLREFHLNLREEKQ